MYYTHIVDPKKTKGFPPPVKVPPASRGDGEFSLNWLRQQLRSAIPPLRP